MRQKLIDILTNVSSPMMSGDVQIGEYKTPYWFAELLADALIENGVTLPTFKVGDIVWVYDFMWGTIPCEVDRPYHCRCGSSWGSNSAITFEMAFDEKDVGDYVFATKKEAEEYWHGVPEVDGKNLYLD